MLKNSIQVNIINNNKKLNIIKDEISNITSQKYEKYKQYEYYTKICQNI